MLDRTLTEKSAISRLKVTLSVQESTPMSTVKLHNP